HAAPRSHPWALVAEAWRAASSPVAVVLAPESSQAARAIGDRAPLARRPIGSRSDPPLAADRIEILLDDAPAERDRQSLSRPATTPAPKPQQQGMKQRAKPRRLAPKGESVAQH